MKINRILRLRVISLLVIFFSVINGNAQGPSSPEAAGFEPVDATDMVSLSTGDLSYVLPLMSVEGFPVSLSYHAGMTMDMDASWVGLGWYLNPGAINRTVTNTPDDWKNGVGMNFTTIREEEEYYGVTVELGLPAACSVGVGMNWGGGKGLSGSVSATLGIGAGTGGMVQGGVSGSVSTTGEATVGAGIGVSIGSIQAGANVSYSLVSQRTSLGFGVGIKTGEPGTKTWENSSIGVGGSLSSDGTFSIGAGTNFTKGSGKDATSTSAGAGMSSNSFSQGDANVDVQSTAVALPLHAIGVPLTLGFSKTKVTINIKKGYINNDWGALYSNDFSSLSSGNSLLHGYNNEFRDYMVRTKSMDVYSTRIPQQESEFTGDRSADIENINFTSMGYDSYNVAALGLMGNMTPRVFKNATIFGKGERTKDADGDDIHVFYHRGYSSNAVNKILGAENNGFNFYFDGQFTSSELNNVNGLLSMSNPTNINQIINEGNHNSTASNSYSRAKSPNYVQVFTNAQIESGFAKSRGLITPKNILDSDRNDISKFDPNGIGAYMITSPDGKVYHFSLPVYHFEQIHRMQINDRERTSGTNKFNIHDVSEKRQFSRYATHWLLTAMTGSDYVDVNGDEQLDSSDYGYWVELEYGKWSEGFVWRTPYEDLTYDYNTNMKGKIENGEKGNYSFGRKQMYYLDKIHTANRTALFVKSLRKDAIGKELNFKFSNYNNRPYNTIGHSNDPNKPLNQTDPNLYVKEPNVHYKKEYSLRLDKIILVNSKVGRSLPKDIGNSLGVTISGYNPEESCSPGWQSPYFNQLYGSNYTYTIHNENNILDINDNIDNIINYHALKVVEFDYDYSLAKNSPSSDNNSTGGNPDKGRLTLKKVHFKGKKGTEYMLPTKFDYYLKDFENISLFDLKNQNPSLSIEDFVSLKRSLIDNWGFFNGNHTDGQNRIKAWSLKEITAPTGAKIEIDYEEDDYWIEAFARRVFREQDLKFRCFSQNGNNYLEIGQMDNTTNHEIIFSDYFKLNTPAFIDLYICHNENGWGNDRDWLIINNYHLNVISVSNDYVRFIVPSEISINGDVKIDYDTFSQVTEGFRQVSSSRVYNDSKHCSSHEDGDNNVWHIIGKILANKVPEDEVGGGLRVKELRTIDNDKTYKVTYDYNHPTSGRSSGITSYAPVNGIKYVPYQSELPSPGVMYEYVTMKETTNNDEYTSKTQYRHHVLNPVFDIFNPNIEMSALDADARGEDQIFSANVIEDYGGYNGNNNKKIKAKKIEVNINTALIGQLKSVKNINSEGQVMMITENEYINGGILSGEKMNNDLDNPSFDDAEANKGYIRETFNSLKSVMVDNNSSSPGGIVAKKRLLSISSKTEYNNMLKKTISTSGGHQSWTEYTDVDPILGSFRKSTTKLADGTFKRDERIPAYEYYPQMGSKVDNPTNKNMLTQEAMNISSISTNGGGTWKTINANVTTWNKDWIYRDNHGNLTDSSTEVPVWRKHKNYVWKEAIDSDGAYETNITKNNTQFNWGVGIPTNDNWQKTSEITQYTHWSSPVEVKDINDNFASTKMADNWSKVIATSNAKYSEMYYSGAEHITGNVFDGEVRGSQFRTDEEAHTGDYSVKNNNPNDKVFEVLGNTNGTQNFRTGKYKVAFWVKCDEYQRSIGNQYCNGVALFVDSNEQKPTEVVRAGQWVLYNYTVDISSTFGGLYVTNTQTSGMYFDDFRMHPVYASMNAYVYDQKTDELAYILDGNNLATYYCYDDAGRLGKVFKEAVDDRNINGGFKLINHYKYHYKNSIESTCECKYDVEDLPVRSATTIKLEEVEKGEYARTFSVTDIDNLEKYTFEWQWLTDAENNVYSDFILGDSKQSVPYAPKSCDEKTFDKIWEIRAKITNIETNEIIYAESKAELAGCKFEKIVDEIGALEISKNYEPCSDNSKYTFRIYLPKQEHDNYIFEFQTYNPVSDTWSTYTDVTNNKGIFCPTNLVVESLNCKGERMNYYQVRYRITDLNSSTVFVSNKHEVFLDCTYSNDNEILVPTNEEIEKYTKEGNVLIKEDDGKLKSVYNLYDSNKK